MTVAISGRVTAGVDVNILAGTRPSLVYWPADIIATSATIIGRYIYVFSTDGERQSVILCNEDG